MSGFAVGDRVVWLAPAAPGLAGMWAKRVDVPATIDRVNGARVRIRPEGTVYVAGKGDRPERVRWVDVRFVRRAPLWARWRERCPATSRR